MKCPTCGKGSYYPSRNLTVVNSHVVEWHGTYGTCLICKRSLDGIMEFQDCCKCEGVSVEDRDIKQACEKCGKAFFDSNNPIHKPHIGGDERPWCICDYGTMGPGVSASRR